jgi:imidazolonepropionase
MREAGRITDAALAAHDGRIVFVGPTAECDWLISPAPSATVIDATGCAVVPGFVDAHTHVVFAGDRRHELARRLGATYAEISPRAAASCRRCGDASGDGRSARRRHVAQARRDA